MVRFFDFVGRAFLPDPCRSCRRVPLDEALRIGLCLRCRGGLKRQRAACACCGRPFAHAETPPSLRCGSCRLRPPPYARLWTPFVYQAPLRAVIHALKFERQDYLAEPLADLVLATLAESGEDLRGFDGVVPVPLHFWRRWRRGFDQAERLGRRIASRRGLLLMPALRRVQRTPRQSDLPRRQRLKNLRGAFRCRRRAQIHGRRLLLVDDVVTSGATLSEAARTLRAAGAVEVVALAIARTPEES